MTKLLIPPDNTKCQVVHEEYHPFQLGGPLLQQKECGKKPAFIVHETKPGSDGLKGSMSMCEACFDVFKSEFDINDFKVEPVGE